MSNGESVTQWLDGVKEGKGQDIDASGIAIFNVWCVWLVPSFPVIAGAFDEEDVAISAFQSFCDRAGQGQFPQLSGRDELWLCSPPLRCGKPPSWYAIKLARSVVEVASLVNRAFMRSIQHARATAASSKFSARSQARMMPLDLPIHFNI